MRILALILFACSAIPLNAQEKFEFPKDGNGLLDYCNVMIEAVDSPQSITSAISAMGKLNWCTGYLQATQDSIYDTHIYLAIIALSGGLTLEGTDKTKAVALDKLRGACIPDHVSPLQMARVLVKWLREHPERLHEPKSLLVMAALQAAFPCESVAPKETTVPTKAKP